MPLPPYSAPPCHCLIMRQAARQVTQLYDRHLAPMGLRATQYSVLRMIERNEPLAVQALAARMVMDRTTLSRALRPLQREGLVAVTPGRDARTRLLAVTPAGRAVLERLAPAWGRAQAEFERRYGTGETQGLRGMLSHAIVQTA